jgi:hypothetical protein
MGSRAIPLIIPYGQVASRFAASEELGAEQILNMTMDPDGVLCSVSGPALYEPITIRDGGVSASLCNITGVVFAVHHAYLRGGRREVLLAVTSTGIHAHVPATRSWSLIKAGVSTDVARPFPPQFLTFGSVVIYCDGVTEPLVITENLDVMPLGFTTRPGAPDVLGPENPGPEGQNTDVTGSLGYSFPGALGTPGDRLNNADSGTLRGAWRWRLMYEDFLGNLSVASAESQTITFGPLRANIQKDGTTGLGVEINDLTRGVALRSACDPPDHTRYVRVYQTPDTLNESTIPQLLARVPCAQFAYHEAGDVSATQGPMPFLRPTPIFHCMAELHGHLYVAEGSMVFRSQPGIPGTWPEMDYVTVTRDGAQVTALAALNGRMYAFTRNSMTDVTDLAAPQPVPGGVGCVGPSAVTLIPGSGLVFVHDTGVYLFNGETIDRLSATIERQFRVGLNKALLSRAVAWYSPEHGEARFAVPRIGSPYNRLILTYSPALGWRELDLGIHVAGVTITSGADPLQLVAGTDFQTRMTPSGSPGPYSSHDIYVLDREIPIYTPPARVSRFRSNLISFGSFVSEVSRVLELRILFVETYEGAAATVRLRRNFENGFTQTQTLRLDDVPGVDSTDTTQTARAGAWGSASVGLNKVVPRRRSVARALTIDLSDVHRLQFEIEVTAPVRMALISMEMEVTDLDVEQGRRLATATET